MDGVSPVELEERCHKFVWSLKYAPLGCHDEEHEAVYQLLCACLTRSSPLLIDVLLLLSYLQIHRSIPCLLFLTIVTIKIFQNIANYFCIYFWYASMVTIFSWIIEKRTSISCYLTFFTFYLGHTKVESSLLFVLEGRLFWLIVCVIFTTFNINVILFISWKPYVMPVKLTCRRWSTDLLDVDLIKENKLGGCHRGKLFLVIPLWYMPCLHIPPFFNYWNIWRMWNRLICCIFLRLCI